MAKLPEDAKRKLEDIVHSPDPISLTLTTSSAAVEYTVSSLGYDASDMKAFLEGLDQPHLQALQDQTLHPSDVGVPKPDGFDDGKYVGVSRSFATAIKEDRKEQREEASKGKDRSVSKQTAWISAIGGFLSGAVVLWLIQRFL